MEDNSQGLLTQGPIFKTLTKLALPIMASSFLATLYNLTDMAWIGTLGSKAVAGVGAGSMYCWFSTGVAALTRMGGQVHVAQCLGRNEASRAKEYGRAALHMVLLTGVLFGLVCGIFTKGLIGFFKMDDTLSVLYAEQYLRITCGLMIFNFINYTLTGLFTAQGDSRTPLIANFIGLLMNMILDPVLIRGIGPVPRLEVVGAAIATVTSQILVLLVFIFQIFYKNSHRKENDPYSIFADMYMMKPVNKQYYKDVFRIGFPSALQTCLYCCFSMVLTRIVAVFGTGAVAVQKIGGQIESVCWYTADGFGAAMNAFVGQNYGAGKQDRLKKGYQLSFVTMVIFGSFVTLLFVLFPRQISGIFFHEEEVIRQMIDYIMIVGFCEAFMCVELMAAGAIAGLGFTKLCSVLMISMTGLRIPLAMILKATSLGVNGVWIALLSTSVLKGIVLHLTFLKLINSRSESRDSSARGEQLA